MAGYSKTPLAKKPLPDGVTLRTDSVAGASWDVIVVFLASRADLERRLAPLAKKLGQNGGLWAAWPKKTSGVATDLTEGRVRTSGLELGLVDNKVCAIDDTWSGLRFVVRLKDRR